MQKLLSQQRPEQDSDATVLALTGEVKKLVAELHPRQLRVQPVTLDSSMDRDLGLDSLARVELLARIESSFGVSLPERVFVDAETVRDLLRAIEGAQSARAPGRGAFGVPPEPGETIILPHGAQTLVEVLDQHVRNHPDRPHVKFYSDESEERIITYRRLRDGATALATGLQQRGIQTGEPVVIMLPTGQDYFFAFWGVLLAGGIPVPIYPPMRRSQMEDHLRRHRACVLVANHASYLDSLALVAALPRQLSFVAKAELAGRLITRLPLDRLQTHFVERFDKQKGIEDARSIGRSATGERPLVFFAEGTFTRAPGLLPFHMGAFVTAVERAAPVVPIAIRGTRSMLRSDSWFPRRGTITIHIGKPVEPDEMKRGATADVWAAAVKLRDMVREDILRHCGEPDLVQEKWPI